MTWSVQLLPLLPVGLHTHKAMKRLWLLFPLLIVVSGCEITTPNGETPDATPLVPTNLLLGQNVNNFWTIPSIGNPKVLVVPVEFSDRVFANPNQVSQQINQAFNGVATNTFQSLNSFYKTSSFGKLNLDAVVTQPFRTQYQASYYENLTTADPNTVIIDEIMQAFDATLDFNDFDLNGDGKLDGLYMVYNHPAGNWNSFWWAYLYSYFGENRYDGILPTSYVWMPYESIVVNNQIVTSTLIHETGHKLGLEDYYDYAENDGSGNEYGLGGADMMDASVGDHNPFSKMLLGWIDPLVVTEDMDVTLLPYISSGQALLITDNWQGTLYDEYLIAMYYTPTGFYQGYDDYYFDGRSGMVLYHIDARLGPNLSVNYPTQFLNNNTDSPYKLIKYIEADGNNSLYFGNPKGWMWASDVYRPSNVFGVNRSVGYRWHQTSRGDIGFTIRVFSESYQYRNLTLKIRYT
jgi:M6 family metalloprotease-like protein